MRTRSSAAILLCGALAVATFAAVGVPASGAPVAASGRDGGAVSAIGSAATGPTVYVGSLTPAQLGMLVASGVDRDELGRAPSSASGTSGVEVVLEPTVAASLVAKGVPLREKTIDGTPVSTLLAPAATPTVFKPYSGPGGLLAEYRAVARAHPRITKLETIGTTIQGKPIVALKVTKDAKQTPDGRRPSVLYLAAQHAREWITPEVNRRLMHYLVDGYGTRAGVTKMVDHRELWFVPVANPDGYDYTFTPGNRLWRKNLRDNDGDGKITGLDGVDPNRNFPTKWGYDNEGSSPSFASETYRGTGPASEPETQAMDGLFDRVDFRFVVNYHSAAELLLYGVGWQVSTPSPDDQIYQAMAGDDAHPAVPGFDPDISAELYTTNGETDDDVTETHKTLAFTPELTTCQDASDLDPDDAFDASDCESVFNFPDSEPLIQGEFEKNLPFALSVARSAGHPDDPDSVVGRSAPDFVVDSFSTSYGSPQPVSVTARRSLTGLRMQYSIDGGPTRSVPAREWHGGERYGDTGDSYYAEYRGVVRGAKPGDRVAVYFTGTRTSRGQQKPRLRTSNRFVYTLASDTGADVLVLADEDYDGVNPTYPLQVSAPKYAGQYQQAIRDAGLTSTVWDVSSQGVPDPLGVLGHFDAVVWYLGDNRLTQDRADEQISYFGQQVSDLAVAERAQYLTLAVRDYLNEGGKLVHSGETAAYFGQLGADLGGIYYGLNGAPHQECVVTTDPFHDCLLLADDFAQYYLGASNRLALDGPTQVSGTASGPFAGFTGRFGGQATVDNPLDEAGSFIPTSEILPPDQFPQFASRPAAALSGAAGGAYDPVEGSWYVAAPGANDTYTRLGRTVDLAGVAAGARPSLDFSLSYDTEPDYDHVIVEAHTVGSNDWTTLPETGGLTTTDVPADCDQGFLIAEHPFLTHYLTQRAGGCDATGSTGAWNAMTGNSGGWQPVSFDLSAYAGKQVEVVISEVTDPASSGVGVFVDDTKITVGGQERSAEGFETGLGPWTVQPPPAGSPAPTLAFERTQSPFATAITTRDTAILGFGVEQLAGRESKADVLGRALYALLP